MTEERKEKQRDVVINSAQSALKSAFLVNSGGALAILGFFGHGSDAITPVSFINAMPYFISGLTVAAVASGLSFLAQYGYYLSIGKRQPFLGKRAPWLGRNAKTFTLSNIILVFFSYILFIIGAHIASHGLSELIMPKS